MRKIVFVNDEKQTEYKDIPANVFDAVEHLMDTYGDIYSDINREKIDCEHTDCNNCVNHKYCDYEPNYSEIPTGSTTKNDLALIHTEGLDEEIRCTMCTNSMKSDRGCDGSCVVNKDMYKAVMDAIEKRIQPTTKNDLGVDCISREQAKAAIRDKFKDLPPRVEINTILNELPSVTPQEPKTGHWDIKDNMWWVCSACGCQTRMMKKYNVPNFCPACGAKMVEPQESEEV